MDCVDSASLGYWVVGRNYDGLAKGDKIAIILYNDGLYFSPSDWQGYQPDMRDLDDIADTHWVDTWGRAAIMLDNLPRTII